MCWCLGKLVYSGFSPLRVNKLCLHAPKPRGRTGLLVRRAWNVSWCCGNRGLIGTEHRKHWNLFEEVKLCASVCSLQIYECYVLAPSWSAPCSYMDDTIFCVHMLSSSLKNKWRSSCAPPVLLMPFWPQIHKAAACVPALCAWSFNQNSNGSS